MVRNISWSDRITNAEVYGIVWRFKEVTIHIARELNPLLKIFQVP